MESLFWPHLTTFLNNTEIFVNGTTISSIIKLGFNTLQMSQQTVTSPSSLKSIKVTCIPDPNRKNAFQPRWTTLTAKPPLGHSKMELNLFDAQVLLSVFIIMPYRDIGKEG